MANLVICEREELVAIADAIREKTGTSEDMALDQMATAITDITGGGTLTVTDDGNGNVVMSYGSATTIDDGNGNVVIE